MKRSPLNSALKRALFAPRAIGLATLFSLVACGTPDEDELTGNVQPTANADSSEGDSSDSNASETQADTTDGETGNPPQGVPATYRFTCIDIQRAGSADDDSLQAGILQDAWAADVEDHKLNIMVDFLSLDEATGDATLQVRSGIGGSDDSLCSEASSDSAVWDVTYDQNSTLWGPDTSAGKCAGPADSGATSFGTFDLQTTNADVVYIYAEDDDGTSFNCTDSKSPDAVPIRAVQATFTMSEDESVAYGHLTGCLVQTEAQELCSCIGTCIPPEEPYAQCGCNPDATPLADQLLGVTPTDNCTEIMGEPAYDMEIAFVASRLPIIPETCG